MKHESVNTDLSEPAFESIDLIPMGAHQGQVGKDHGGDVLLQTAPLDGLVDH